jgi:hypothetical protein
MILGRGSSKCSKTRLQQHLCKAHRCALSGESHRKPTGPEWSLHMRALFGQVLACHKIELLAEWAQSRSANVQHEPATHWSTAVIQSRGIVSPQEGS